MRNYFNQPWLDFTGRTIQDELGTGWEEDIHPQDRPRYVAAYIASFDQRQPFKAEYRLRRHDGEYRWVLDTGVPRIETDGSFAGYIGSALDVTERKRSEEALASVSGRLIEAQEKERRRIARELHDDINQRLALLANELQALAKISHDFPAQLHGKAEQLSRSVTEIATDIQALSHTLHSSKLEFLGIAAAMRGFCAEFGAQQKVQIDFGYINIPDSIPRETSLCLFRILQEGLMNAVRHSGVHHFDARLRGLHGEVELTVRDSGKGFDPEAAESNQGLGLVSMRERVGLVNGTISIISKPMHGTEIRVRVPFAVDGNAKQIATWD
jgi:PAS domain S-box-containing protein